MQITDTPWGRADLVETLADGITQVATPSHGGIYLSDERLKRMPESQRTADGWYEEDCEAWFVVAHFYDEIGGCMDRASVDHAVATMGRLLGPPPRRLEGGMSRYMSLPAVNKRVPMGVYLAGIRAAKAAPETEFKHGLTTW